MVGEIVPQSLRGGVGEYLSSLEQRGNNQAIKLTVEKFNDDVGLASNFMRLNGLAKKDTT
jgi:hypothetical protein